jgi:AcrR family transcriptional regulator
LSQASVEGRSTPRTPGTTRARPTRPLSRDLILRTALAIVDRDGLEALSMRRLATELGVEPMSLYHHIANKGALIDGVIGQVLDEVPTFRDLSGTWQDRIREAARRLRQALVDHPRAAAAVATRPVVDVSTVRLTEDALGQLTSFGLSLDEANEVLWLCNAFVMGTTVTRAEWSTRAEGISALQDLWADDPTITSEAFPLALAGYGGTPIDPEHAEQRFEIGIDILLAGIAVRYPHIHDPEA